ncbi:MAG: 3-hydroxyacyl-ACP dehydratase FabZ family protein [Phycisphaerales bacterium JB064]
MSGQTGGSVRGGGASTAGEVKGLLFSLDGIDLSSQIFDAQGVERVLPHRGDMRLIDRVVWHNEGYTQAVAARSVKADEFWVPGHFPGKPMFPGVLQIEAGAQLACFMFLIRHSEPYLAAFLRIENAAFRSMVAPGDELIVLGQEVKFGRRRFTANVQGMVGDRIAFEATVSGMAIDAVDNPGS